MSHRRGVPAVTALADLVPAARHGWHLLLDLTEEDPENCLLIGGQMMYLLAVECGSELPRPTDDIDVVVDVRARPGATRWLAGWLIDRGFDMDPPSTDGLGHRFRRAADPGPGEVVMDVLAPEGLGEDTDIRTSPPARTVQAPGANQAFDRSELVVVAIAGDGVRPDRTGRVRRPSILAALILKAAATRLAVRLNPERDWEDAALLLTLLPDLPWRAPS